MKLRVHFTALYFIVVSSLTAQEGSSLLTLIQSIEEEHETTLNYDPDLIAKYKVKSVDKTTDLESDLQTALLGTDLEHLMIDGRWVIAVGQPKPRTICGLLLDINGQPLPFANIQTGSKVNTSDSLGNFRFQCTSTLNALVEFTYLGFEAKKLPVKHWIDGKCKNIKMGVDTSLSFNEIVVVDYILRGISKSKVDNGLTINYPKLISEFSSIERDAFNALQLLPGIKSIDDSAMGLYIHGATPSQNLVLWEDATLYDPGHLFGMISPINPQSISEIRVYKDGADPYYDSRVGGVIDISSEDHVISKWSAGIGQSLTTSHGFLKGPLWKDKVSIALSGRLSASTFFESPTISNYSGKVFQATKIDNEQEDVDDGLLDADFTLDFTDWNAKLVAQLSPKTKVMASYMSNTNSLFYFSQYFDDDFSANDAVDYSNIVSSASLSHKWSPSMETKIVWTYSDFMNIYEFNLEDAFSQDTIYGNSSSNNINETGLKLVHSLHFEERHHLALGADINTKSVSFQFTDLVDEEENYEEENSSDFLSPFLRYRWQSKFINLSLGLRSNYFSAADIWRHAPRLAVNIPINSSISLNASAGRYYQFISQLETFYTNDLSINNSIWLLNDEDDNDILNSEKFTLGLVYSKNNWQVDLDLYSNTTKGITTITSSINRETFGDILGQSRAKGMDLSVSKKWKGLNVWLNYSLSENRFDLEEEDVITFDANQFQRHHLNFITTYSLGNWTFSGILHYSSGLPYTDASRVEEIEDDNGDTYFEIEIDEFNGEQLPSITRVDFGLGYSANLGTSMKLEANFTLRNILNKRNLFAREFLLVEEDEEAPEILTVDKRLLPRTPQVSINLFF